MTRRSLVIAGVVSGLLVLLVAAFLFLSQRQKRVLVQRNDVFSEMRSIQEREEEWRLREAAARAEMERTAAANRTLDERARRAEGSEAELKARLEAEERRARELQARLDQLKRPSGSVGSSRSARPPAVTAPGLNPPIRSVLPNPARTPGPRTGVPDPRELGRSGTPSPAPPAPK